VRQHRAASPALLRCYNIKDANLRFLRAAMGHGETESQVLREERGARTFRAAKSVDSLNIARGIETKNINKSFAARCEQTRRCCVEEEIVNVAAQRSVGDALTRVCVKNDQARRCSATHHDAVL
jgi:hypothetical protein